MNKTKAMSSHNKVKSPSPDSRTSNLVKPTRSPIEEIEKFILGRMKKNNMTKQSSSKKIALKEKEQNLAYSIQQQAYKKRIKDLEEQLELYKGYMKQYEALAEKNKKLQEQMSFILQELQSRCSETIQISTGESPESRINQSQLYNTPNYFNPQSSPSNNEEKYEVQYLQDYVDNLEKKIQKIVQQSQKYEQNIKKNLKRDLNEMQQRLMNYIFGLEERVSQATLRNNEITRRGLTQRSKISVYNKNEDVQLQFSKLTQLSKQKPSQIDDRPFKFSLSQINSQYKKKDSIIQSLNFQEDYAKQSYIGKSNFVMQTPKGFSKCLKCIQNEQSIQILTKQLKSMQIQLLNSKELLMYETHPREPVKKNLFQKYSSRGAETMKEILQESSEVKSEEGEDRKVDQPKQDSLKSQSRINIFMDNSLESSLSKSYKYKDSINQSQKSKNRSIAKQGVEKILSLEKIKQQLVTIMQQIQQIIHQCESQPQSIFLNGLNLKLRNQQEYINELEGQINRIKQQMAELKGCKQKIGCLGVRSAVQHETFYFNKIEKPLDCVDHIGTKNKIEQIIKSIKSFEKELDDKNLVQ